MATVTDATGTFDITPLMTPYLDVHMVSPLLDYLREIELYDPKVITLAKIKAVERTNMIELVEDEYNRFPNDSQMQSLFLTCKDSLNERKNKIFDIIDNEPEEIKKLSAFFSNTDLVNNLRTNNNLNLEYLTNNHDISLSNLEAYFKFAKFKYECGLYSETEEMLTNYLSLISTPTVNVSGASTPTSYQNALWGRLACRILSAKWLDSSADLISVKESIEVRHVNPADQLRQRAYLIHWALFVFLNQRDGIDLLIDLYTERYYLQTLENLCPWLLRYYTFAIILSPNKRKTLLKDVLAAISSLNYLYSDPITQFLYSLFNEFDFDIAQVKLTECQKLIQNDFFLQVHMQKFMHEARMLICEMYCTIHRTVDLTIIAEKLHFNLEEAEKWMVDMIRGNGNSASLNAKVDSFGKQVIIAPPTKVGASKSVEATKELNSRSQVLTMNLENLVRDQAFYFNNKSK